jgi:hypothetical protein
MDRLDLLKQLTDKTYEYFEQSGLPPVKCKQLVADRMQSWKSMSAEQLQEVLDELNS